MHRRSFSCACATHVKGEQYAFAVIERLARFLSSAALIFFVCRTRSLVLETASDALISFIIGPKYQAPNSSVLQQALQPIQQPIGAENGKPPVSMQLVFDCNTPEQRSLAFSMLRTFLQGGSMHRSNNQMLIFRRSLVFRWG